MDDVAHQKRERIKCILDIRTNLTEEHKSQRMKMWLRPVLLGNSIDMTVQ